MKSGGGTQGWCRGQTDTSGNPDNSMRIESLTYPAYRKAGGTIVSADPEKTKLVATRAFQPLFTKKGRKTKIGEN